ncbi:arginase family protein [Pseudalkalibacillus sp. A8]|uniref:arginase family protein n=1 Tax=Pseudalkalibacillus sp. A8 TaxID=3382641 RepID=UPI0038B5416A
MFHRPLCGDLSTTKALDHHIEDLGDITIDRPNNNAFETLDDGQLKNVKKVSEVNKALSESVSGVISNNGFPLVIGRDHSIAIGSLAGISQHYHNLGVIWYDAILT